MTAAVPNPLHLDGSAVESFDYARALLNILEDSATDRARLQEIQSAALNILDDSAAEKDQLRNMQSAVLNVLEDFGLEKHRLEGTEKAILNILEDSGQEKTHLEEMKKAVLNILDDLAAEKNELERTQSEVVRSAEAVRLSLREKETLLKEVHHRVKNNLQVIASLLRLQARHLSDQEARGMFEESQNRVHSISLVHEMLYQAGDLARVDFGQYLQTLTKNLFEGWRSTVGSIDIGVEAPGVQLGVDIAIPCGLIVNELVTNALKHGFPQGGPGRIRVSATRSADGWLSITVRDNGVGLPPELDLLRARTLGLELVATLVRQLHAKIDIRNDHGAIFEIGLQTGD